MIHPGAGTTNKRIAVLDIMRGLIMILLAAEACKLYESLEDLQLQGVPGLVVQQFSHHKWHGLRFWDLVQPAFMSMAGAALYISYYSKKQKGTSWQENLEHVTVRCLKLFIAGTALHCVYAGRLVWELWNVLTQLSFTTLLAYLIINRPVYFQLLFSAGLLLLTEVLYRNILPQGFDQPFVIGKNFGSWMDMILMGKINPGGWVAINILPTAVHTILGMIAGRLLIGTKTPKKKIALLVVAGLVCLAAGYALDLSSLTPIIKRISTSSFVLVSAGWVALILAGIYWITDVKGWTKYSWIFKVVGMNAIFIYLFFETVGHQWLNKVVAIFIHGTLDVTGVDIYIIAIISALTTLFLEWWLCYWLFKRKIFFKL